MSVTKSCIRRSASATEIIRVGRETAARYIYGLISIWNFLTFRGTNDDSVFHGHATRKRRGDLQERSVVRCLCVSNERSLSSRDLTGCLCLITHDQTLDESSLFSFLENRDSPVLCAMTEKDNTRGFSSSSSFPSDNARQIALDLWISIFSRRRRRSRSRKSGAVHHFVCWSRSLSVFFNQHGTRRDCVEYFSNI